MNKIKECRLNSKLTQKELAEKIGVTQAAVAKMEKQKDHNPNIDMAFKISQVLKVDLFYLYNLPVSLIGKIEENKDDTELDFISIYDNGEEEWIVDRTIKGKSYLIDKLSHEAIRKLNMVDSFLKFITPYVFSGSEVRIKI